MRQLGIRSRCQRRPAGLSVSSAVFDVRMSLQMVLSVLAAPGKGAASPVAGERTLWLHA